MKSRVCSECLHSFVNDKLNLNRRCRLYSNMEIRQIEKCPLSFSDKDIDWVEQKEKEDRERGYVLYSRSSEQEEENNDLIEEEAYGYCI